MFVINDSVPKMTMRLKTIRPDFRFRCFLKQNNQKVFDFILLDTKCTFINLLNESITKTFPANFAILSPLFAKDAKEFFFLSWLFERNQTWAMVVRQSDLQIFLLEIVSISLLRLIVQLHSVLYIPLQHYIQNEQRAEIRINQKEEDLHHDSATSWPY